MFELVAMLVGLPALTGAARAPVERIEFAEVVFHGMLSALLFADSLHVNLASLSRERWPILTLAAGGVLRSTLLVVGIAYGLAQRVGWPLPFIYCLLFGAAKKLESRITGESLFNDGTGVVLFMVLLGLATGADVATASSIAGLFALEAVFGMAVGAGVLWMLRQIDSYAVEIMLTLALVTAGSSLAERLHLSAPLYVVAAGLVIGNLGPGKALSERTQAHLFPFWQLIDELLNLLLFGLIGLELLALGYSGSYVIAGLLMIVVVLFCRWVSVALPMLGLQRFLAQRDERHTVAVMTWGGLRGGISIAQALSLPVGAERELIVWATYIVVLFSILVQATSLAPLMKRLGVGGAGGGH